VRAGWVGGFGLTARPHDSRSTCRRQAAHSAGPPTHPDLIGCMQQDMMLQQLAACEAHYARQLRGRDEEIAHLRQALAAAEQAAAAPISAGEATRRFETFHAR